MESLQEITIDALVVLTFICLIWAMLERCTKVRNILTMETYALAAALATQIQELEALANLFVAVSIFIQCWTFCLLGPYTIDTHLSSK